jgi:hypothetical protein
MATISAIHNGFYVVKIYYHNSLNLLMEASQNKTDPKRVAIIRTRTRDYTTRLRACLVLMMMAELEKTRITQRTTFVVLRLLPPPSRCRHVGEPFLGSVATMNPPLLRPRWSVSSYIHLRAHLIQNVLGRL